MPIFQGEAPLQLRCNRTDSSNSFRSAKESVRTDTGRGVISCRLTSVISSERRTIGRRSRSWLKRKATKPLAHIATKATSHTARAGQQSFRGGTLSTVGRVAPLRARLFTRLVG